MQLLRKLFYRYFLKPLFLKYLELECKKDSTMVLVTYPLMVFLEFGGEEAFIKRGRARDIWEAFENISQERTPEHKLRKIFNSCDTMQQFENALNYLVLYEKTYDKLENYDRAQLFADFVQKNAVRC